MHGCQGGRPRHRIRTAEKRHRIPEARQDPGGHGNRPAKEKRSCRQCGIHKIFAQAGIPPENLEIIRCKDAIANPEKLLDRNDDSLLILAAPLEIRLLTQALKKRQLPVDGLMPALAFTATGQDDEAIWELPSFTFDASELVRQSIRCLLLRLQKPSAEFHRIMIQGKLAEGKNI